jgi:hypothetical protein
MPLYKYSLARYASILHTRLRLGFSGLIVIYFGSNVSYHQVARVDIVRNLCFTILFYVHDMLLRELYYLLVLCNCWGAFGQTVVSMESLNDCR